MLGNHYYCIRTANGKNRTCTYTLTAQSDDFAKASDYIFEMDIAQYNSNNSTNKQNFNIVGAGNTTLLNIAYGDWATKGTATVGSTTAEIDVDPMNSSTRNAVNCNTWFHITVAANATNGTTVKIEKWTSSSEKTVVLAATKVSDNVITLSNVNVKTGSYAQIGFDNFTLSTYQASEVVLPPTSEITSVDGIKRYVTLTQNDAASIWYNTDGGESYTQYTTPVEISANTTLYYYAQSAGGTKSDVANASYEAGTTVSLASPSVSLTNIINNGSYLLNPVFTIIAPNNSAVLCNPATETIEYTFTPDGGVESSRTAIEAGATYSPTAYGTLKVYASTTGYGESCYEIPVSNYYETGFTYDYSTLTDNPFGETYSDVTATWWTTAYRSTASSPTTLGRLRFGNNTVSDLVIGYGVGRAGNNCALQLRNATKGNVDVLTINNTNSSGTNSGTYNTTLYETSGNGAQTDLSTTFYVASYNTLKIHNSYSPALLSSFTVTIGESGWATLYSPFALDFAKTELTAYTATVKPTDPTVELAPVTDVPANTGVVLMGEEGSYTIPVIASSETAQGELLGSATEATACPAANGTYYVLAKVTDGVQFNPATTGSIAAGKAYLYVESGDKARALNVVFAGETTAIDAIANVKEQIGEVYNLAGQRVAKPAKGLYIVSGKKVMFK